MGLKDDRQYLKERREMRENLERNAVTESKKAFNKSIIDREDIRDLHEASINNFYEYKDNVKKTLMKKALMELYTGSIYNITPREKAICENLCEQYIGEAGMPKLMRTMKCSNSCLLRSIKEGIDEWSDKITAGATAAEPDSQTIDSTDVESFWKDIDKSNDVEDITNTIRLRVSNAEEEFINKNQEDKADIETIMKDTSRRIQNNAHSTDNDYNDAVEVSESRIAREKIYKIQHEGHHNVFDRMVRNLSEVALTNDDAKSIFTESGKLDMDSIVESVRCMYTLLETVNTIGLEKVDQQYIEETIKSIK